MKFVILLLLGMNLHAQECVVNNYLERAQDTTAILKYDGTNLLCFDMKYMKELFQKEEQSLSCQRSLTICEGLNSDYENRDLVLRSIMNNARNLDSIRIFQKVEFYKVLAASDSIETKLEVIHGETKGKLNRCLNSKMSFMDKVVYGLSVAGIGFIAGAYFF